MAFFHKSCAVFFCVPHTADEAMADDDGSDSNPLLRRAGANQRTRIQKQSRPLHKGRPAQGGGKRTAATRVNRRPTEGDPRVPGFVKTVSPPLQGAWKPQKPQFLSYGEVGCQIFGRLSRNDSLLGRIAFDQTFKGFS